MMTLPRLFLISSMALTTLVGCDASDEPSQDDYDDVAVAVSSLVTDDGISEVTAMEEAVTAADGEAPPECTEIDSGTYSAEIQGVLSYSYEVTCTDATGTSEDACSDDTDSASVSVTWMGRLSSSRYETSVERVGAWQLTGLQSNDVQISGQASFTVESDFTAMYRPVQRSYDLNVNADYENLVYDRAADDLSGSVLYTIDARRVASRQRSDAEANYTMDAVLTFDGTNQAQLTLDGDYNYRLDLSSGEVVAE